MPGATRPFADYCCELLTRIGHCSARPMFGGFGLSLDGLTVAIVANLGDGERLWFKADEATRATFEQAGCLRFTYTVRGVAKSMGYYSAPADAMESPEQMAPWARLALQAALSARQAQRPRSRRRGNGSAGS